MSTFTSKPIITSQTLGERLAKVRHAQGWELREIARQTGIKAEYLAALEAGHFSELPGDIYTLQFAKKYAAFLGVGADWAAAAFQAEKSSTPVRPEHSLRHLPQRRLFTSWFTRRNIVTVGGILALLVAGTYLLPRFRSRNGFEIFSPGAYYRSDHGEVVVRGIARGAQAVFLNRQPLALASDGGFNQTLYLTPGVHTLHIVAMGNTGQVSESWHSVVVAEQVPLVPATTTPESIEP